MSADDPQAIIQWREALLWLAKADAEIVGARTLLAGAQLDLAAFHVQQALEKALKALLVAAAQDVRRSHDIDMLATLARAYWPDLLPSPFALARHQPVVCDDALSRSRRGVADHRGGRRGIGGGCLAYCSNCRSRAACRPAGQRKTPIRMR
jgi:hypothetical protein